MHLLRGMRRECAGRQVPQLRGWAVGPSSSPCSQVDQVPCIHRTGREAAWLL